MQRALPTDIGGLDLPGLELALAAIGRPRFHARQTATIQYGVVSA